MRVIVAGDQAINQHSIGKYWRKSVCCLALLASFALLYAERRCQRLSRMGIFIDESHIFTCAMATARFLAAQKPDGTAFVIGEGGLTQALHKNGYAIVDDEPDYVVVGEGRTFNMEIVEAAVRMIVRGSKLIATNIDPNCPTSHGLRPGCGAIVAMLETATGLKAFSVGKPSPVMMRAARKELGLATAETIMIGDTMETDILGGVSLGYHTCLVLSGGTKREDLVRYAYRPDLVVDSIANLSELDITATLLMPIAADADEIVPPNVLSLSTPQDG